MEPVVRYATREDLPRVNELRQQVSELHAAGPAGHLPPGFCEALQQHVYQLFDAPEFDVLVACVGETICGFAAVQYVNRPESAYLCARRFHHIEEFGVDDGFRRHGVGTALLRFCQAGSRTPGL